MKPLKNIDKDIDKDTDKDRGMRKDLPAITSKCMNFSSFIAIVSVSELLNMYRSLFVFNI